MEKQRSKPRTESCRRLLIGILLSLLFSTKLFSQFFTSVDLNNLTIKPAPSQDLYTNNEIKFEVLIPKVKANQVQIISSNQDSGVILKTLRKTEDYENNGTLIEMWFIFDQPGNYKLKPLQITAQSQKKNINFEPVSITDDPAKQLPRIAVRFNSGETIYSDSGLFSKPVLSAPMGKTIAFTVYLQYTSHLINFSWDIPKDAIFSQTKTYDIMEVRYREKSVSHELIPVASFEWVSLTKGIQTLPKMKLSTTGFNGLKYELIMPELSVDFSEGDYTVTVTKEDEMFDAAFSTEIMEQDKKASTPITKEICQALATLYSKERNSIFNQSMARKVRQQYEIDNNLHVYYERDYSLSLVVGSLLLFIGGFILFLISLYRKKTFRLMFSFVVCIIALIPAIYALAKHFEIQGICTGCTIYSIPEETAEAKAEMSAGNKVRVTEKTDNWYYIELGETGGWCKAENVIIIK